MSIIGRTEIHQYEDDIGGFCLGSENESPPRSSHILTPSSDNEKRMRREIANSNERRRMQSINAGFQSLRTLLPHHEGEKLSKAAILQQTAEYIWALEQEKTRLLAQNCQLKRLIEHDRTDGECTVSKKRKTDSGVVVVESADEGLTETSLIVSTGDSEDGMTLNQQELIDIRMQLDRERGLRLLLEEKIRNFQSKNYTDRIRDLPHPMQVHYDDTDEEMTVRRREADTMDNESDTASGSGLEISSAAHISVAHTETVVATPMSPMLQEPIQSVPERVSILETTVIKSEPQEPRVEVERVPASPEDSSNSEDASATQVPRSKVFLASASRPNLETIVEAIRHLEGDNLFEDGSETQDVPLALTKHQSHKTNTSSNIEHPRTLRVDMSSYLQFHQQQRPGVIVVKHS